MAQNKVQDLRIAEILSSMADSDDPEVKENICWGIGELAGAGIGDDHMTDIVLRMMSDPNDSVRGMAVWAAGRLIKKLSVDDIRLHDRIQSLKDDDSEYVRKSVEYALDP